MATATATKRSATKKKPAAKKAATKKAAAKLPTVGSEVIVDICPDKRRGGKRWMAIGKVLAAYPLTEFRRREKLAAIEITRELTAKEIKQYGSRETFHPSDMVEFDSSYLGCVFVCQENDFNGDWLAIGAASEGTLSMSGFRRASVVPSIADGLPAAELFKGLESSEQMRVMELLEQLEKIAGEITERKADENDKIFEAAYYDDDEVKAVVGVAFMDYLESLFDSLEDDLCEECDHLRDECECED